MRKLFQVLLPLVGISLGIAVAAMLLEVIDLLGIEPTGFILVTLRLALYIGLAVLGLVLGILSSPRLISLYERGIAAMRNMPIADLISGTFGLALGLFIAFLLSHLVGMLPFAWLSVSLSILLYVVLGYFFMYTFSSRRKEIVSHLSRRVKDDSHTPAAEEEAAAIKLLDTSVIIDGRIYDICKTGFLEGTLVVPNFVLNELRTIADADDSLKRSRGRRGLDILAHLQNELSHPVQIDYCDFDDITDVDEKLLRLAGQLHAAILTNDFNLNKVARVQNISVLNINDLANAVKPVVLPGECMKVHIIKPGKESSQGVAYLSDGTMVVVERAAQMIGEEVNIVVTSALQTSAGRMIFGRVE